MTLACLCLVPAAVAAPGAPDPSFGSKTIGPGSAVVDGALWPTELPGAIGGMAFGPGGTIVIAGSGQSTGATGVDFLGARLLGNGRIDRSFGTAGVDFGDISGDDRATGVAVDQDGSAYFVTDSNDGTRDMIGVAKVQPNGSFDPSFAGTGRETLSGFGTNAAPYAVALQRDGKIVVAGYATVGSSTWFAIARLLPDGSLDPTFSGDGRMLTPAGSGSSGALALAIDSQGRIVVAGASHVGSIRPSIAVLRLTPGGSLDPGFGAARSGVVVLPNAHGPPGYGTTVAVAPNGQIVVGNAFGPFLVRFTGNGRLDSSFGKSGLARLPLPAGLFGTVRSIALQRDGKVVVGGLIDDNDGTNGSPFVARVTVAGKLDDAFGNHGYSLFDIGGPPLRLGSLLSGIGALVAVQPDGRIVAADDYTISEPHPPDQSGFFVKRFLAR